METSGRRFSFSGLLFALLLALELSFVTDMLTTRAISNLPAMTLGIIFALSFLAFAVLGQMKSRLIKWLFILFTAVILLLALGLYLIWLNTYKNGVYQDVDKAKAQIFGGKKVMVIVPHEDDEMNLAGGVLVYGIPEFRLPKSIVAKEIDGLKALGVDIETNMVIGKTLSIDELMKEYGFEAVFIGSGAGLPKFMNIPGENLKGVYSANEFLTRINLMKAYKDDSDTPVEHAKNVAVVGGGNVAMDAARCAKRLGANVYIVYRRSMEELPARKEEVEHAEEEGIIFKTLTNPVEIHGDETGNVCGMTCVEMELGEPDASGRRRPIEKSGSDFKLDVDCVIMALGTSPNPLIKSTTAGLETQKWGGIIAEEATGLTSREGVYAGGDAVTGAATVILAMGAGKNAAEAIDEYLKNKH